MIIKAASSANLSNIAALHIRSWRDAYAGILPAAFLGDPLERALTRYWCDVDLQPGDVVLVAENNSLCGFIAVWCRPAPYLDNLHVLPSLRAQSIGTALLKSAAAELLARAHKSAYLWVFERNPKAIRFYQRMGGVVAAKAPQDIFGYSIPSLKIEWRDLGTITDKGRNASAACDTITTNPKGGFENVPSN